MSLKVALILTGVFVYVLADSCSGRCGKCWNAAYSCHCNSACTRYGDCCLDYWGVCLGATCSERCGQSADITRPCQCNSPCVTYGDCCDDYHSLCADGIVGGGGGGSPTDPLSAVMNDIWNSDTNRFTSSEVVINTAGNQLFTWVNEDKFYLPTFQTFINLLNNYERTIGVTEIMLDDSYHEIETFLDAVLETETMALANIYLLSNGKVESSQSSFRDTLKELWFNLYPRSSSQSFDDSSGFEHVMVGELRNGKVSGFHNWIQFYLQEKAGSLTYITMVSDAEPSMKNAAFTWYGGFKSKGSFFLGTSPEFDMALYSICALMYPNARCNFTLKGYDVSIQTWDIDHMSGSQIGSAYLPI